jgi:hypothetical protein
MELLGGFREIQRFHGPQECFNSIGINHCHLPQ